MTSQTEPLVVAALYKFTALSELEGHKARLSDALTESGVRGTILLAPEGVNGTISGSRAGIDAALSVLRTLPGCADLEHKESQAADQPFLRLKVRLKKEIVTMGVPTVDPTAKVGRYVAPEDWNAAINEEGTVLIDTRNDYEVAIGTFEGAIDPKTTTFRDFPKWFRDYRQTHDVKKVAMFCTGGIRCEKASSFLLDEGIDEVLHLKGGILKYLETVPEEESTFDGACFVFDQRVAVGHGLEETDYIQCFACRRPLKPEMTEHPAYLAGISCHQCVDEYSDEKRAAFEERHRQVQLAKARGEAHLGDDAKTKADPAVDA